jgi:hypothetical protein
MNIPELKTLKIITIRFNKHSDKSVDWEIEFEIINYKFRLFIIHNPSYIKGEWYCSATLRLFNGGNFELNYGFSNYKNTSKYVLKAIVLDLITLEKTGKFSKYVSVYHNTFSPKNLKS